MKLLREACILIQMESVINEFEKECTKLEGHIKIMENFLAKAPEGSLICKKVKQKVYYYHQIYEEKKDSKSPCQKYIKKKNIKLARVLAQKSYYTILKPIMENQLKVMRNFINSYQANNEKVVYESLSFERKQLVEKMDSRIEDIINEWNSEEYHENDYFYENKILYTDQGERVRSKSELIIANMLYYYKDDILYKYERPLFVDINGIRRPIYPDFTVLNKKTGKITYIEHVGCLDNPEYADRFVKKINTYIENGIIPGKDLVLTYETSIHPLDVICVRKIIENILEK